MEEIEEKIAWIGLGNMGHPMAKNLEAAGFAIQVFNRDTTKSSDFESPKVADSLAELIRANSIIFLMIAHDQACQTVLQELLAQEISGKLIINMSTISQQMTQTMAQQLKEKAAAYIDAPVAGSTQPAKEGTLVILVGGEETDYIRARPFLEKLGKKIKYLGGVGQGIAAKLSINYFLSIIYQGLAETVLFAEQSGISRSDMLDIINSSATGSGATKVKTPKLVEDEFGPAFALDFMLKDIKLALQQGLDQPLSQAILTTYQQASASGLGNEDVIGIINYLKKL